MAYVVLTFLHVAGAAMLLGAGAAVAAFMLMAHRTKDPAIVAATAKMASAANAMFVTAALVLEPLTGVLLAQAAGYALTDGWIVLSIMLYILAGALWLPAVWTQMRIRRIAREAIATERLLPTAYHRLFVVWATLCIPAFAAVLGVFWLMVARPSIPLW